MNKSSEAKLIGALTAYYAGDLSDKTLKTLVRYGASFVDKRSKKLNISGLAEATGIPEKILNTRALRGSYQSLLTDDSTLSLFGSPTTATRANRGLILRGRNSGNRQSGR